MGKEILSMASQKDALRLRNNIFTPLELYLDPHWQEEVDPGNTVYFTAAASSGGYRAYLDRWGTNGNFKPDGNRQHAIISMNTALITYMVDQLLFPDELQGRKIIIPHNIGAGIPSEYGTLVGKNEAHLMMQWMMRIAGVSEKTARQFYQSMETEHTDVTNVIGDPKKEKSEKFPYYIELLQTFLDTLKQSEDKNNPLSAIILGLDWKHSLGSRLEAALAYLLKIPMYEMVVDGNHPNSKSFLQAFRLEKIIDLIHFPITEGDGSHLVKIQTADQVFLKEVLKDITSQLT